MSGTDWQAVDAALDEALDAEGPAREAVLARLDPALRARVRRLVAAAVRDDTLLDDPRAVLAPLAADRAPLAPGDRLGAFTVGEELGAGGMGQVYRAVGPDGQAVALKVVRETYGLRAADVAARLRRERALLASLDHPGIARFIDGGEADDGTPFLAMELVEGASVTEWANGHRLGALDRVALVAEVARAVHHAHERGVLHRDLKPSNVLVQETPAGPRPVVLDFGIGKALADHAGGPLTRLTRTGQLLMTLAYGAPELARPGAAVTPATDVFGLAVVLYELLVCVLPYRDGAQHGPSPPPPPPPLSDFGTAGRPGRRAAHAAVNAACLRALDPVPERRFASARAFAEALEEALAGERPGRASTPADPS